MKKLTIIIFIFSLIFSTALIKNSTKKIEDEIFAVKESLKNYENELITLHQLLISVMKCKQGLDKENVKKQVRSWNLEELKNKIYQLNDIELTLKKNSSISLLVTSDFLLNI